MNPERPSKEMDKKRTATDTNKKVFAARHSPLEEGEAADSEEDYDEAANRNSTSKTYDLRLAEEDMRRRLAERHADRRATNASPKPTDSAMGRGHDDAGVEDDYDRGRDKRRRPVDSKRAPKPKSLLSDDSEKRSPLAERAEVRNASRSRSPADRSARPVATDADRLQKPPTASLSSELGVDTAAIQLPDSPPQSDVEDDPNLALSSKLDRLKRGVDAQKARLLLRGTQDYIEDSPQTSSSGEENQEPDSKELDEDESAEMTPLPWYLPSVQGCRSVDEFECLNRIEEGTYGVVYRAKDKKTQEIVALKRLKMEKERDGFPITSLREISTLMKAQHENIVTVREVVVGNNMDRIFLVMEYVEHDLKSLMEVMNGPFSVGEVKCLLAQLLRAVNHMHDNWILHRDLKTSNLLLSHKGVLKVGDFGLAREYGSPLKPYTEVVVTLWYRAPELLLGAKAYSCPIDLWSVGCIFAEFLLQRALFPAKSEIEQLGLIFKALGTPEERIWPGVTKLQGWKKCVFQNYPYNMLRNKFTKNQISDLGFDLLNKFLTYCPQERITAEKALKHQYFQERPRAIDPSMFPSWPAKSEGNFVKRKQASPRPPPGNVSKLSEEAAIRAANLLEQPPPPMGGRFFSKKETTGRNTGTGGRSRDFADQLERDLDQSSHFVLKF